MLFLHCFRHEFHISHPSSRRCIRQFWIVCWMRENWMILATNSMFMHMTFLPTIFSVSILRPWLASSRICRRKLLRLSRRVNELRVEPIGSRDLVLFRTIAFQSSFLLKFKHTKNPQFSNKNNIKKYYNLLLCWCFLANCLGNWAEYIFGFTSFDGLC